MTTIALCNQKGGTGKTTTVVQLARAAVVQGRRTLVIDADPQGNASATLTADLTDDAAGLADVLTARSDATVADVLAPGVWPGLEVVPTVGGGLGIVRDELVLASVGRETRLRAALSAAGDRWDVILIDCGPSLDQLTINALTAADAAVAVTRADEYASMGLVQLLDTIAAVRAHYQPGLSLAGVLVNAFTARSREERYWLDELRTGAAAGRFRLLDPIPHRSGIREATAARMGVDEWTATPRAQREALAALYAAHLTTITKEA